MLDITELVSASDACHISSVDVRAITPHVIAATFEEILHKKCIWEQFYRDNRDILDKPGKNVVFPGAYANNAFTIGLAECHDITTINAGHTVGLDYYTATTISVQKIGGFFSVSREAIKFAMRDVLRDNLYETGLQYKEAIDDAAYFKMMYDAYAEQTAVSETMDAGAGPQAFWVDNIIQIVSIAPTGYANSILAIDYCDGTIYYKGTTTQAATLTFRYGSKPGLCVPAARPGSTATGVTAWGILDAKAAMIAQGRDPDVVIMSYNDIPNLLYDEKVNFLDASAYTSHEPLYNAEVGKLWGLKVVTESRRLPQGCALMIDVDRMGYDVHKEELNSYREDVYKRDAIYYYFYAERGFGVTDTLALCKVVGGVPDFPATHPVN